MDDIHNSAERYEQNRQKLENSDSVSEENKDAIQKFIEKSFAQGISKARVRKYLTDFHSMLKLVDDFKLLDADQEDLERLVAGIEQADYAEATKSDFKCVLKKFYKVMEGNGREYPEKVDFIDTSIDKSDQDTTGLPSDQIGVCGGIVLAEGSPAEVGRSSTAEGLLRDLAGRAEDTDFDYLLGHTDSEGTVENHDVQYANGFSSGDLRSIDKEARRRGEPGYFEVLVTPGRPVQMTDGTKGFDPDNWNIMASHDDVDVYRGDWSDDNPPESNMSSKTFLQYNKEMREDLDELANTYDVEFLTQ